MLTPLRLRARAYDMMPPDVISSENHIAQTTADRATPMARGVVECRVRWQQAGKDARDVCDARCADAQRAMALCAKRKHYVIFENAYAVVTGYFRPRASPSVVSTRR